MAFSFSGASGSASPFGQQAPANAGVQAINGPELQEITTNVRLKIFLLSQQD